MGKGIVAGFNYSLMLQHGVGPARDVTAGKNNVACPVAATPEMLGLASCTPGQLAFLAAEMEFPQPQADAVLTLCTGNICGSESSSSNHS